MNEWRGPALQALKFINETQYHVFLTGKAGTGKTTLLNYIYTNTHKRAAVVAPTGIAALNAKGTTIHSFFQLPFATFLPVEHLTDEHHTNLRLESRNTLVKHFEISAIKKAVLRNIELLIIDEVSMLRPDVLDAIDAVLRRFQRRDLAFGGVQILYIGDLLQLPPVIKQDEWQVLQKYYQGQFFFHAQVIQEVSPVYIELDKIYRQEDQVFIDILNELRNNTLSENSKNILRNYVKPDFKPLNTDSYITLSTHNLKADQTNQQKLKELLGKTYKYEAEIIGEFNERIYPIDSTLELKLGAQVMFIKNDQSGEKLYFNGKIGIVEKLSYETIQVKFLEENKVIELEKFEWQNVKYTLNQDTKEIIQEVLGTFVQYPIKLAWAITVHKSQGLTFDKAILDVSEVFMPGQLYVALSRLRSLEGLVLKSEIKLNSLRNSADVINYAENKPDEVSLNSTLTEGKQNYIKKYLLEGFTCMPIKRGLIKHINLAQREDREEDLIVFAQELLLNINALAETESKFYVQLSNIFNQTPLNLVFLKERVEAAQAYFFNLLKKDHLTLLTQIFTVGKKKRSKLYFNELAELDELFTAYALKLIRIKSFLKCITGEIELNKDNLSSLEENSYKSNLKAEIQNSTGQVEDDFLYKKEKKQKLEKGATYLVTFELWKEKKLSISEIAIERKLSEATIQGHFAKLIADKAIKIEEVMSTERVSELTYLLESFDLSDTLSPIKESLGDKITWGELKLMAAHFQV